MSEYDVLINKYDTLNAGYDQLYPATKIKNVDGLDTALQNNDPRKWGIGTNAVIPSGRSANNITADGLYYCDVDTPTVSDWLVYHAQRDDNWAVQLAVCSNAVEYGLVIRKKMSGVWKPWEWDNPPMELGKEYRTTKRFNGHPVYALRDNFGPNTNEAVMYYGNNVNDVVYGIAQDGSGSTYPWYNGFNANPWSAWFSFAKGVDPSDSVYKVKVTCFAGSSASNSYSTNTILVKYTKTTD